MKKVKLLFTITSLLILVSPLFVSAQEENQPAEWIRVQSDNGEFSVEVPASYDFYVDKDGFLVSDYLKSYQLTEMKMLNVYQEKTLLSFEVYKTTSPKSAADILDNREDKEGKKSEMKFGESKFKQILIKKENLYAVRRYFTSKDYLYILTAASRTGETLAMKRFLDSLALNISQIKSESSQATDSKIKTVPFSALKISRFEIDQNPEPVKKSGDKTAPRPAPVKDENYLPITLIAKPGPSYTNAARRKGEEGVIKVRLTFSKNGSITKISFLSILKEGLLRESLFAAIRLKYIPAEKNGEPIAVTRLAEYEFGIY